MNSKQRGFTLLELLITITILAILINTGTQGMQWLSQRTQASTTRTNIERIFATARFSAVTDRTIVTICPLGPGNKCTSNWNNEVSIFKDPDNLKKLATPGQLLRVSKLANRGNLVSSSAGSGARRYFQYDRNGAVKGSIGHLVWCPPSKNQTFAIQARINFGGRLRWASDRDGDGVVEGSSGQAIQCPN